MVQPIEIYPKDLLENPQEGGLTNELAPVSYTHLTLPTN